MSKAEERALKAYPKMSRISEPHGVIPADNKSHYLGDANEEKRESFIKGYHQAEKDLELTWEDLAFIRLAFDALEANIHLGAIKIQPMTKEYYQEVLKRFKDMKNGTTKR